MKGKRIISGLLALLMVFASLPIATITVPLTAEAVEAEELKEDTNYMIVSKQTGMAMTVSGFAMGNDATIVQWPVGNYASQVWTLDKYDDYYQLVNNYSGKVMNVPWASKDAGVTMIQFTKGNADTENDKWQITDAGEGYCRITPKLVDTFGLKIKDASVNRGADIIQDTYNGGDNELWQFVEVTQVNANPEMEDPKPQQAIDRYLEKFFYVEDNLGKLRNMPGNGFWTDAEVLEVFIDAYERLGDAKYLTVAEQFYDGIIKRRGTDWAWNGFNDDVMWMVIATARLYANTGDTKYLETAKANFDMCYTRAWSTDLGGGLWWTTDNNEKNACVNGPGAIAACLLAEATGEESYYTKAAEIITWEYNTLFDKTSGAVWDNIKKDGTTISTWASTYNQGTFIGAATMLYKHTEDVNYYNMAKLAADYSAKMGDGAEGYLNREQNSGDLIGFKGILARWLGYFTRECNVTEYDDWMMKNAKSAWTNRNSDDLMWTEFGRVTIEDIENSQEIINDNNTKSTFASWGCSAAVSWLLNCTGLEPAAETEAKSWEIKSPDRNTVVNVELSEQGTLTYSVKQNDITVVEASPLGMTTSLGDFTSGLIYKTEKINSYNETYEVLSGKKAEYTNIGLESEFVFTLAEDSDVEFSVLFRTYDDGVAFRYAINTGDNRAIVIEKDSESTGITLPAQSQVWYMPHENDFMFEGNYLTDVVDNLAIGTDPSMPMLYGTGDKLTLIAEADKHGNYVGSVLELEAGRLFRTKFDPQQNGAVQTNAPFASPWRAFVIGDEETIINNTMVENLSPAPDARYNFEDWVEPGVSSWSWVSYYGGQEDPEIHKKFIDLAAKMGWKYYILDEKWQPESNTEGSQYEGMWAWFDDVKAYADDKGVELIAWVDKADVDTDTEREARFSKWSEIGIAGIKVDFFYTESQEMLQLHDEIYADAAKYKLLVNVHGSNPPSGEIRTYPNVIAREAIRGQEQGGITAEQYTLIPFIRAAVGTADVTEQLYSRDTTKTTMGFQIALSTLVQNGIRSLGSKPEEYYAIPEAVSYYMNFPSKWDDTKLISAEVGRYINIARKSENSWYAAGISVDERDVTWKPDFLDADQQYTALIYTEDGLENLEKTIVTDVTRDTDLSVHVLKGGGYAVKFLPQSADELQALSVTPASVRMQAYYTKDVELDFTPTDTKLTDVTWEVADTDIAKVTAKAGGATIKGLKEGTTQVTATSVFDENVKAVVQVEVTAEEYTLDATNWTIFNDDAEYLITGENKVEIQAETGIIDKNVFAMKVPDDITDFTAEVKVSGNLNANYQGGFLGVFNGQNPNNLINNYLSVGRRYHTDFKTGGEDTNNHFAMMSGQDVENYVQDAYKEQSAYLKLVKEGNRFTGYYRFHETDDWTQIDETLENNNFGNTENLYVGFYASTGGSNNGIAVTFEDFKFGGENAETVNFAKFNSDVQAESFTVEFDSAGGSGVEAQIVYENEKVVQPTDPTRENYKFAGWYVNGVLYDFDRAVTKNLKLIAKWDIALPLYFIPIEAELSELSGNANIVSGDGAAESSNGEYVGNIGGNNNGTATFYVDADLEGVRTLKIQYCTFNARDIKVVVNGEVVKVLECPGTGNWGTPNEEPFEVEIELKEGENIIQLTGVNGEYAPNLDKIEIELAADEAKNLVAELIKKLPEEITEDNKGIVTAVKEAYDSLPDKTGVEGAEELKKAIDKLKIPESTNTDELSALIERAKAYEEADYTEESWAGFAKALAEAKEVLADTTNRDQTEVDNAVAALHSAIDALEPVKAGTGDGVGADDETAGTEDGTGAEDETTGTGDGAGKGDETVGTGDGVGADDETVGTGDGTGKDDETTGTEDGTEDGDEYIKSGIHAVAIEDQIYTGSAIKPFPVVYDGEELLTLNKDYTVKWKNNKNVSTESKKATVIIKGKGNYKGTYELPFNIVAKDINPNNEVGDTLYGVLKKGNTVKVKPTVTTVSANGKTKKLGSKDYSIEYSYVKDGKCEEWSEGGSYLVTVTGKGNYKGTIVYPVTFVENKNMLMKNAKITIEPKKISYEEYVVNHKQPTVIVKTGKTELKEEQYTIDWGTNKNVGKATITIIGDEKTMFGKKNATFTITGENIKSVATVEKIADVKYTGEAHEPRPVIKVGNEILVEGNDYLITQYAKNIKPGTATITIRGMGKYEGKMTAKFKINKVTLTETNVKLLEEKVEYTKAGAKAAVEVTADGRPLVEGKDYKLSYKDNKTVGTATVMVTGKGGYADKVAVTYVIEEADFDNVTVSAQAITSGTALKKIKTTVTDGNKKLGRKEYNVSYKINGATQTNLTTKVAKNDVITVIVTAASANYKTDAIVGYKFTVKDTSIAKAKAKITAQPYTGDEVKPTGFEVKLGKTILKEGTDYVITGYDDNVLKSSKATVTIEGIGDYCGTKTFKFKITQRDVKANWTGILDSVKNFFEWLF